MRCRYPCGGEGFREDMPGLSLEPLHALSTKGITASIKRER
jgi:hypothetical protein